VTGRVARDGDAPHDEHLAVPIVRTVDATVLDDLLAGRAAPVPDGVAAVVAAERLRIHLEVVRAEGERTVEVRATPERAVVVHRDTGAPSGEVTVAPRELVPILLGQLIGLEPRERGVGGFDTRRSAILEAVRTRSAIGADAAADAWWRLVASGPAVAPVERAFLQGAHHWELVAAGPPDELVAAPIDMMALWVALHAAVSPLDVV